MADVPGLEAADPRESRTRPRGIEVWLVAAVVAYAGILLIGPLVGLLWGAVRAGAGPFWRALTNPEALHAIMLTLIFGVAATVINAVLGTCAALVLVRDNFRGKRILNGLVDVPLAVSPVIAGFMLILLFGRGGWLTPLVNALGIPIVFALPGMLLATTFVSMPFVARELVPVLEQIGTESESAAYTMGASAWTAFWRITLPAARWGLFYGLSLTFARAIGEFGAVLVVSGSIAGLTETATLYVYRALDERHPVDAHAVALVLALFSFVLLLGMEFFRRRRRPTSS
ncbi:MAG: molybdate ABC transporter permease subunit [Thermoanaerobaculia bacterium]